jgi:hypothetical protein
MLVIKILIPYVVVESASRCFIQKQVMQHSNFFAATPILMSAVVLSMTCKSQWIRASAKCYHQDIQKRSGFYLIAVELIYM